MRHRALVCLAGAALVLWMTWAKLPIAGAEDGANRTTLAPSGGDTRVLLADAPLRGETVRVSLREAERLVAVERPVPSGRTAVEAALEALVAGPTAPEAAEGVTTSIPAGTRVEKVEVSADAVGIALSPELAAEGVDDRGVEEIYEQFRWTLEPFDLHRDVRLTVGGVPLALYLMPKPLVGRRPEAEKPAAVGGTAIAGTALTGREISLSPGHGRRWGGSSWVYDRPVYCAPLSREDLHNVELVAYLNTYLQQDGATTRLYRCIDKNYGTYPLTGNPWWYMSGSYWLKQIGYPCWVYASSTGDCNLGSGSNEASDCIRSRPLASDYDATDIHIAMHTNGYTGDCYGTSCPNGTATYYDGNGADEHAAWATVSRALAQDINPAIVDVIRNQYPDATWRDRGYPNDNGSFAETRIPDRAAALIELAFHDSCDRDALYLRDNFFRSATMWGVYKGICDYFGTAPTHAFYAAEYVSDTIPAAMAPGESRSVSLTFRNRGVLWTEARQFRLGAGGESDPFAATRHTITGEVDTTETYTFTFTMTAPLTPGSYTTDWRMVRDGFVWFGPTVTKQVEVAPARGYLLIR